MARSGVAVHETIHLTGCSATEASQRIALGMGSDGDYTGAQVGPSAYQYVRVFRPTWAMVAGFLTTLVFGLGVLFFFIRRTESCTIAVVEGPTGAVLTIAGKLLPGRLDVLRGVVTDADVVMVAQTGDGLRSVAEEPIDLSAVEDLAGNGRLLEDPSRLVEAAHHQPTFHQDAGQPIVAGVAHAAGATLQDDLLFRGDHPFPDGARSDETVARRPRVAPVVRSYPANPTIRFDDGREVPLAHVVIVGRDPSPSGDPALQGAELIALPDPDRSLSKTHVVFRSDATGAWVEDLHSTNGTVVLSASGQQTVLVAGRPHQLTGGSIVQFGHRRAEIIVSA